VLAGGSRRLPLVDIIHLILKEELPELNNAVYWKQNTLQLIAVPKARIGNLLFWDVFKEFPVSQ
jgi:hypothetical protein